MILIALVITHQFHQIRNIRFYFGDICIILWNNTIMKPEDLPEFVKPYKVKGYDVRKRGNRYVLFKISSQRVKDKKYPVLKQECPL